MTFVLRPRVLCHQIDDLLDILIIRHFHKVIALVEDIQTLRKLTETGLSVYLAGLQIRVSDPVPLLLALQYLAVLCFQLAHLTLIHIIQSHIMAVR